MGLTAAIVCVADRIFRPNEVAALTPADILSRDGGYVNVLFSQNARNKPLGVLLNLIEEIA